MGPEENEGLSKPKRFRTAYNFFFMHERDANLKSQSNEFSSEEISPSSPKTSITTKRKHLLNECKVGFTRRVSQKWKQIPADEKRKFEAMARKDLERYQKEFKDYQKKTRDAAWEKYKLTMEISELKTSLATEENEGSAKNPQQKEKSS
eukprot:3527076-Ditylum_brightwellii.AAC.1